MSVHRRETTFVRGQRRQTPNLYFDRRTGRRMQLEELSQSRGRQNKDDGQRSATREEELRAASFFLGSMVNET